MRKQSRTFLIIYITVLLLAGCRRHAPLQASIVRTLEPRDFASGSALVRLGDSVLVAGDDAPYLLLQSLTDSGSRRIPVSGADTTKLRLEKKTKPDWEGGTEVTIDGQKRILFFGSGSLSPWRDSLLIIEADWRQWKVSLTPLYNSFRRLQTGEPINIEGAAVMGNELLLFERGKNALYRIPLERLDAYLASGGQGPLPTWKRELLQLPAYTGQQATISGACLLHPGTVLLSASMEVGATATTDGRVLGSYLASLQWKEGRPTIDTLLVRNAAGAILPDKIESVELVGREKDGRLRILALVDNDDGQSRLHELLIQLPK